MDLSGHWKLNEADSDDPQRLMQSQLANATAAAGPGGRRARPDVAAAEVRARGGFAGGPVGPAMPSVIALDEALRWPGKDLVIKQSGGMVTFSFRTATNGSAAPRCRPAQPHRSIRKPTTHPTGAAMCRRRFVVGMQGTLVVQSGEPEDERPPFEHASASRMTANG